MLSRTERTYPVTQIELTMQTSHSEFTRALESLLGEMQMDLNDLHLLSPQAVCDRLTWLDGPLGFTLFQKIDHGVTVTALTGHHCEATTYVFGNALIAIEITKHVARAGLYLPLRLFVEGIASERVGVTYDLPSSLVAPFGSPEVYDIARRLDDKVERMLDETLKAIRGVPV
jgi:uncharacterized protein (DUF302 family)